MLRTEVSTILEKSCLWGVERGWQPFRHLWADCLDNMGSLMSHNPICLHGLLTGIALLFLYFYSFCYSPEFGSMCKYRYRHGIIEPFCCIEQSYVLLLIVAFRCMRRRDCLLGTWTTQKSIRCGWLSVWRLYVKWVPQETHPQLLEFATPPCSRGAGRGSMAAPGGLSR
jgi:hypothetical protein